MLRSLALNSGFSISTMSSLFYFLPMQQMMRMRGLMVRGIIWIGVIALVAINAAALAQTVTQSPQDPNQKRVS
jgi:hypothetical protein